MVKLHQNNALLTYSPLELPLLYFCESVKLDELLFHICKGSDLIFQTVELLPYKLVTLPNPSHLCFCYFADDIYYLSKR